MQIVIKIPEEQYNTIKSDLYNTFPAEMKKWGLEAIRNGIPLPKGHGRILDEKDILDTENNDGGWYDLVDMPEYIAGVKPIIEADNAESEEISDRNLKMWEEIFAEERRRKERK